MSWVNKHKLPAIDVVATTYPMINDNTKQQIS